MPGEATTMTKRIDPDRLIPDLLGERPELRPVLDRHGMKGCGGRLGPYETLRFFARAHGVDEPRLLAELEEALERLEAPAGGATPGAAAAAEADERPTVADSIYRRYFLAGIVVVLTAGATWGAWLLWTIGLGGSFRAVSFNAINAHGEAQIFGWVGLFIMGFAYQAFPRFWQSKLAAPHLAVVAFGLMIAGLVLRTGGLATADAWAPGASLALAGGLMEVAAVCCFASQMVVTLGRSGTRIEPYIGFVLAALGWFVVSSGFSVWHSWRTTTAANHDALLWVISTYQAPLRDLQIHGLALSMILGVSVRMLPGIYGLPRISERRAWWGLGLLTAAVAGETIVFLLFRWTDDHRFAAALLPMWMMVGGAVLTIAWPWRLWRPFPETDRSAKFVRAAYGWLAVSLVMLLSTPVYIQFIESGFSHAYFGATRHAITVGFVSLMIVGISSKVVPTLNGVDPRGLSSLIGPFLLINLGCLLRVTMQTATDWTDGVYPLIGLSGTLEVAGLAWWGGSLAVIMWRGRRLVDEPSSARTEAPERIEPCHRVGDVLDWFPRAEAVLLRHGFTSLQNPVLRRTVARRVTLAHAAAMKGVNLDALLDDLNASARGARIELPVLNSPGGGRAATGGSD